MSKHTPAEHWELRKNGLEVYIEGNQAARAYGVYKYGNTKANMRLIAAAPDLLEASEQAREFLLSMLHAQNDTIEDIIHAYAPEFLHLLDSVITKAKAKGGRE